MRTGTAFALHASGHAGAAPAGQDLVCAAASALLDSLRLYLRQEAAKGRIAHIQTDEAVGKLRIVCIPKPGERDILQAADCIALGLQALARDWAQCVRFDESPELPRQSRETGRMESA